MLCHLDIGDTTVDKGHPVHDGVLETFVVQRRGFDRSSAQISGLLQIYITRCRPAGALMERAVWKRTHIGIIGSNELV